MSESTDIGIRRKSRLAGALRQFGRHPSGMVGLAIMLAMIVLCVGAPLFTDADPREMNVREMLQPPSAQHPFGTDVFGRDLLARALYGGRTSLMVACIVTAVTAALGMVLGAVAGFYRKVDGPLMRVMDLLMSFPDLLLAIAIVALLGPRLSNVVLALTFAVVPRTARLVRGMILSLKEKDFITAARAIGAGDGRIMMRHLIPNVIPVLVIRQTLVFGSTILAEGGLNFLGIGLPPEVPSLGRIVAEGQRYLRSLPSYAIFSGLMIALLILGINLLGDGLRDVLDPRLRQ